MNKLSSREINKISSYLNINDIKSCMLVSKVYYRKFRQLLWKNLVIEILPFQSYEHEEELERTPEQTQSLIENRRGVPCGNYNFQYQHYCVESRFVLKVGEYNILKFVQQLLNGQLIEMLAYVQNLTLQMPMLFPEPLIQIKKNVSNLIKCDYISLCQFLLRRLSAKYFDSLKSIEVLVTETTELFEIPVLRNFLLKFPHVHLKLYAVLNERFESPRMNYGLDLGNLQVLKVECQDLKDATALCGTRPLPEGIKRLELMIDNGKFEASRLREFILETNLQKLTLNGDVTTKTGVIWLPRSLEQLNVTEHKEHPKGMGSKMIATKLTDLSVDLKSGHILRQLRAPSLRRLKINATTQSTLTSTSTSWTPTLFEAVATTIKTTNQLHKLEFCNVPYKDIARLLTINVSVVDSLVIDDNNIGLSHDGIMDIAETCTELKTLVVKFNNQKQLVNFLRNIFKHNSHIKNAFVKFNDLTIASLGWLYPEMYHEFYDNYTIIPLSHYRVDIATFKHDFKVKSGIELTMDLLQEKLSLAQSH